MGGKDGRRLIEPRKRGKRGMVGVSVVIDENNVFPHLKIATQFARPRPCTSCWSWLKRRAHCKGKRIANAVLERKEQKGKKKKRQKCTVCAYIHSKRRKTKFLCLVCQAPCRPAISSLECDSIIRVNSLSPYSAMLYFCPSHTPRTMLPLLPHTLADEAVVVLYVLFFTLLALTAWQRLLSSRVSETMVQQHLRKCQH